MQALKEAIETRGSIISDKIVKVDSFLNHQVDVRLVTEMGEDFYNHFKDAGITKVLTLETSGITPAFATAIKLDVPFIFIKKAQPSTMNNPVTTKVFSFTKNKVYEICMERDYLSADDKVLFIDDFLANGEAFRAVENEFIKIDFSSAVNPCIITPVAGEKEDFLYLVLPVRMIN